MVTKMIIGNSGFLEETIWDVKGGGRDLKEMKANKFFLNIRELARNNLQSYPICFLRDKFSFL